MLGVLDAADRNGIGSVDTFEVHGVFGEAETVGVGLAVFVFAPETGALAELAIVAVVESVTGGECEETQGVGTGLLPGAFAAEFSTLGLGREVFH